MNGRNQHGGQRGVLAGAALFLAALLLLFPLLPSLVRSAAVIRLLDRSRERYRRNERAWSARVILLPRSRSG